MSSKISANRRLEELTGDNERHITAHTNIGGENCVAWFFANKQLKMEIQIEELENEVQELEDERDDKDEEIEKLKAELEDPPKGQIQQLLTAALRCEAENKELTEKMKGVTELHNLVVNMANEDNARLLETIKELEEENAKLKAKNTLLTGQFQEDDEPRCDVCNRTHDEVMYEDQDENAWNGDTGCCQKCERDD